MKCVPRFLCLFLPCILFSFWAEGQSPQQFAYQAVVRDNNNQLVGNRTIGMRVSILKDSTNGQSAYTESHTPKTNQQGIIQLNIGGGTVVSGSFTSVPWSSGKLFVKTEMDLQGGTNYTLSGTTQLLSVPYAMYSSNVPVSKSGDTVTIGTSKLIIPGSQLLPGTAPASLSNGLVAYYPFNGNANDESGNGNHGTVNGAILTTDRFGNTWKAYEFNGTSTYIEVKHSSLLMFENKFTLTTWVNIPDYSINTKQDTWPQGIVWPSRTMIGKPRSDIGTGFNLIAVYGDSPYVGLYGGGMRNSYPDGYEAVSKDSLKLNKWEHVVLTYNGAYLILYKNGLQKAIQACTLKLDQAQTPLFIGKEFGLEPNTSRWFKGKLDDIRIYNRALTQEEITYLANN